MAEIRVERKDQGRRGRWWLWLLLLLVLAAVAFWYVVLRNPEAGNGTAPVGSSTAPAASTTSLRIPPAPPLAAAPARLRRAA
jgi:hypothetical protein